MMEGNFNSLFKNLFESREDDDFVSFCYDAVDEIEKYHNKADAIDFIFRLMEDSPNIDFGTPGPFVHFIEEFEVSTYEEKLLESLSRKPVFYTLWILNRLINVSVGNDKEKLLSVMREIINQTNLDVALLDQAKEYIEFHQKR